jgi:hypothetical protein
MHKWHCNVRLWLDLMQGLRGQLLLQLVIQFVRSVPRQFHLSRRNRRVASVDMRVRRQLFDGGGGRFACMLFEHSPAVPCRIDDKHDVSVHSVRSGLLFDHCQRAELCAVPRRLLCAC